jgi:hypothetical protein
MSGCTYAMNMRAMIPRASSDVSVGATANGGSAMVSAAGSRRATGRGGASMWPIEENSTSFAAVASPPARSHIIVASSPDMPTSKSACARKLSRLPVTLPEVPSVEKEVVVRPALVEAVVGVAELEAVEKGDGCWVGRLFGTSGGST